MHKYHCSLDSKLQFHKYNLLQGFNTLTDIIIQHVTHCYSQRFMTNYFIVSFRVACIALLK